MLPFGPLKKASKSQENGSTLVASNSEDVDDYFLDELSVVKTKEKKCMKKMRNIFQKKKIIKQYSASSDEVSDEEGGQIPLCVADDFGFVTNDGGLAGFDYKSLKNDLGNFANAIFSGLNKPQGQIQHEKKQSKECKDEVGKEDILQNEDGHLIADNSNSFSKDEDNDFTGRPVSIINFVRSISTLKECNCSHDADIPTEIRTTKVIPKKLKVTGTMGLSRVQRANNVAPNSTLSPRCHNLVRPRSKEGRLPLPDSSARSMSNVLLSGRRRTSSSDSENDDFKENEPKVPREQLKRATKDYNSAVNSTASRNMANEPRIPRGLSFAGRNDRKELDPKTFILQGSQNWVKHSNSKNFLKSSRSESSSITSSLYRRSNHHSSNESRNKNSVVISHVDGDRLVRSRVAVMQGLK